MADEDRTIRYVIEFDTDKGEASLRNFFDKTDGSGGGGDPKDKRKNEDETFDLAQSIGKRLKAGALGGLAFADSPGQVMGAAGAVVGGMPGMVIAGFGVLADKITDTVRSLSEFDGGLFASTTELDFFMMGWKIEVAQGISDAFADMVPTLEQLMVDVLPFVVDGFRILATVTKPVIEIFSFGLRNAGGLLEKVNKGWGFLIDSLMGTPANESKTFTEHLSAASDALSGLVSNVDDANRQYDMMKNGHAISMAALSALDSFAAGEGHGSQGLGGPRFEQAPPVGLAVGMPGAGGVGGLHSRGAGRDPGGFPRPEPAAVNFKVTDQINVQAADEQQIYSEMLQLREEVMGHVYGMMDQRWMALAEARAATAKGFGE